MTIKEDIISDRQADALCQYFKMTAKVADKQVHTLSIENSNISDGNLAKILQGLCTQKLKNKCLLKKFIFQNGHLGVLTAKMLETFIPELREIWINNIQTAMNKKVAADIVYSIADTANEI